MYHLVIYVTISNHMCHILVTTPITPPLLTHWEYRLTLLRTENTASHSYALRIPPHISPSGTIASLKWFWPKTILSPQKSQPPAAFPFKFPQGQQVQFNIPPTICPKHAESRKGVQTNVMSLSSTSGISPKPLYLRHKNQYMCLSPTIAMSPSP